MRHKTYIESKSLSWSTAVATLMILLLLLPLAPLSFSAHSGSDTVLLPVRTTANQPSLPPFQSELALSKGRFLIASREMKDPRFAETVLLLIEYSHQGAVGLIINRPTEMKLSSALPHIEGLKNLKDILYFGGPVNTAQMTMLIRSSRKFGETGHVFNDVYYSSNPLSFLKLLYNADEKDRFHIYLGYAGWAPRQLDSEVLKGDWHVFRADADSIFEKDPAGLWQEFISRVTSQWVHKNHAESITEDKG